MGIQGRIKKIENGRKLIEKIQEDFEAKIEDKNKEIKKLKERISKLEKAENEKQWQSNGAKII